MVFELSNKTKLILTPNYYNNCPANGILPTITS